ncbi:response regulator [Clostridium neuense]|uniref:Stage 0 sporulation protein A homolog n=1 Tax=Clostridium neuense TaxID=1728934 RepID=A0ABW8TEP1_9CLOT
MNNTHTYKLIVVEDEHLIRRNIIKKINSLSLPFEIIGEASNGEIAISLIEQLCPPVIITDIKMPQLDGLQLIKYLHKNHPHTKTIVLSGYDDFSYAQTALKYGVKDFLLKPIKLNELSAALQNILVILESEDKEISSFAIDHNNLKPENLSQLLENYLLNNYATITSITEVSQKFGFTNEYLSKIFKKYTGVTPLKYITRIRINEAKQLLINQPDLEIKEIGELIGYKDAFYFSRVFKSNVGVYPSDYRMKHLSIRP